MFIYEQPVFVLVNVSNEQITTFENIPPLRREVLVHRDGNYFYWAVALWKDEISDEKHEEIPRSSDSLFEVFELQLFFLNSLKDLVRKSKITGTPAETVDILSVVYRSQGDRFVSLIVKEERVQLWADYQRWFVCIHHNKEALWAIHHLNVPQWYAMLKHAITISCYLKVTLLALFCFTKPRKTLEVDLTHVQKTGTA